MTEPISIYILAGGQSSRMGQDKGLLTLGNQKVIEHILETTKDISQKRFIVTSNPLYQKFSLPLIPDIFHNIGPAGGIDAVLHFTDTEYNLILSCDMPFVDQQSIETIIKQSIQYDITIPLLNGYPEAMLGIYKKKCKFVWRQAIEKRIYKMKDLLDLFNTNLIDGEMMKKKNPLLFTNLNTPQDLEKAIVWFKK